MDRRLLGVAVLLAIVAGATAAVVLVGGGGGASELGSRGAPIRVVADLAPRAQFFGDTVTARVVVTVDAVRVNPSTIRVRGSFGAYSRAGAPTVRRRGAGRDAVVYWTQRLRCLAAVCLLGKGGEKRVDFPPAVVTYRLGRGERTVPRSVPARWPALQSHTRIDPVEIAALDPRGEPPWRADLAVVPKTSVRIRPNVLAVVLYGAAALLVSGFVFAVSPYLLRELGGSRGRRRATGARLTPYEQALVLIESDVDDDLVEAQRHALELVATELGRRGDQDLELSARRLAWSPEQPTYDDRRALAASARRLNGKGGSDA